MKWKRTENKLRIGIESNMKSFKSSNHHFSLLIHRSCFPISRIYSAASWHWSSSSKMAACCWSRSRGPGSWGLRCCLCYWECNWRNRADSSSSWTSTIPWWSRITVAAFLSVGLLMEWDCHFLDLGSCSCSIAPARISPRQTTSCWAHVSGCFPEVRSESNWHGSCRHSCLGQASHPFFASLSGNWTSGKWNWNRSLDYPWGNWASFGRQRAIHSSYRWRPSIPMRDCSEKWAQTSTWSRLCQ